MASAPMTEEEAAQDISILACAEQTPVLSPEQLNYCVRKSRRADATGCPPSHPDWLPTFDTDYGAMLAWELKSGNAAKMYDVKDANLELTRSQLKQHCDQQAQKYRKRQNGTI